LACPSTRAAEYLNGLSVPGKRRRRPKKKTKKKKRTGFNPYSDGLGVKRETVALAPDHNAAPPLDLFSSTEGWEKKKKEERRLRKKLPGKRSQSLPRHHEGEPR